MFTAFLISIVIILYVCGAFLMRALLKEACSDDKDSWNPIILWPCYVIVTIYELIRDGELKW